MAKYFYHESPHFSDSVYKQRISTYDTWELSGYTDVDCLNHNDYSWYGIYTILRSQTELIGPMSFEELVRYLQTKQDVNAELISSLLRLEI